MSELGHSRRFELGPATSGLLRGADILGGSRHVPKVPEPEVSAGAASAWRRPGDICQSRVKYNNGV